MNTTTTISAILMALMALNNWHFYVAFLWHWIIRIHLLIITTIYSNLLSLTLNSWFPAPSSTTNSMRLHQARVDQTITTIQQFFWEFNRKHQGTTGVRMLTSSQLTLALSTHVQGGGFSLLWAIWGVFELCLQKGVPFYVWKGRGKWKWNAL